MALILLNSILKYLLPLYPTITSLLSVESSLIFPMIRDNKEILRVQFHVYNPGTEQIFFKN